MADKQPMRPRASAGKGFAFPGNLREWAATWQGRAAIVAGIVLILGGAYVSWTLRDLPDPNKPVFAHSIVIFDRKGREIEQRNANGEYFHIVLLKDMGKPGPAATLAAEDRSFYNEGAVNWLAMLRALFVDITHQGYVQGGSTITQQLVKIQLLTPQKSIFRKTQEIVLAEGVSLRYSKDQVLEMYLNRVYYGHNAYGLGAASRVYFSKEPSQLTPAQAAFLAGLIQAPTYYDPQTHFERARARQLYVLHGMVTIGALTPAEEQQAEQEDIAKELKFDPSIRQSKAPLFVDYVIQRLEADYGAAAVQQGGFAIYTTLDLDIQALAQRSVQDGVGQLGYASVNNGDLLAAKPDTGEVLAWVGSADYYNQAIGGQYDVILAGRQPGSSFKAYDYEAALHDRKLTLGSYLHDKPTDFGGGYKPRDFDDRYLGDLTMRQALLKSRNIPAVEAAKIEGIDNVISLARSMGVDRTEQKPVLSTAIGGSEITMREHVQGYQVLANKGKKVPLIAITKIVDSQGSVLNQTTPGEQDGQTQVLSEQEAYLLTDVLKDYPRQWNFGWNRSMAAKTGTTGAGTSGTTRDAWVMGYSSDIVFGAWVGNTGANGGGGQINTYGESVGQTILREFVNGLPPTYHNFISRPTGLVDGKACDQQPEIFLPGTEKLACQALSPSPSPTPPPSPSPSLIPTPPVPSPTLPIIPPASPTPVASPPGQPGAKPSP